MQAKTRNRSRSCREHWKGWLPEWKWRELRSRNSVNTNRRYVTHHSVQPAASETWVRLVLFEELIDDHLKLGVWCFLSSALPKVHKLTHSTEQQLCSDEDKQLSGIRPPVPSPVRTKQKGKKAVATHKNLQILRDTQKFRKSLKQDDLSWETWVKDLCFTVCFLLFSKRSI